MDEQFGVIITKSNDSTLVLFEGSGKELFDILEVIKNNFCENAEVKLLDKDEYMSCKDNIVELEELLK